ncbi:MAG: heme lyase CcmF/NrfE family subunit [Alphaproteobacteria bacterium]|nr:heme lyase CcmF/NrfE family subunit [Alphaproteobacteria bacterium]
MIAEIGHFSLILALVVALVQAIVPLVGAHRGDGAWMATAAPTALVQLLLIATSFGCLMYAFVTSDFTVMNVAQNSNTLQPMLYKVSSTWGNHEGSMVLWVLILAVFGAMVAAFGGNLPPSLKARVLSVQAMIGVGFLLFILLTSNPFERVVPPPLDGRDLNPLLQDPGLAFHPPMLYIGYVGFSMAFSFAIAALIEGKVDAAWARWVRPWTLVAWSFLTAGISLGAWWAYYELGWGGWWYWDPVENASFMPWLVGTALLHSSIIVEKRDALKTWTILLAILTFSLSLIGTFLVRSGVLTSVHAFATDPERGVFILLLLVIAIGGSLALYAWRAPILKGGGLFAPISREGALVLNNLLLTTAAATVFIGTLYPLFLEAVGGGKVSVGPPFFNATFVPLMIPLIIALGVGPMLGWKRGDLKGALSRLKFAFIATIVITFIAAYISWGRSVFGVLGLSLAGWLATAVILEFASRIGLGRAGSGDVLRRMAGLPRGAWGMTLAHLGFAITVAGASGASLWQDEVIQLLRPGETLSVVDYDFTLRSVDSVKGPNYTAQRATFTVRQNGEVITTLAPERRRYIVQGTETTEAALYTQWYADIYVVIGQSDGNGAWTVRLYFKPLVPWLWAGSLLMVFGGFVSLSDRRLRIGAPSKRLAAPEAKAPTAQPAE